MSLWKKDLSDYVNELDKKFEQFPLVVEGESKIVRDVGENNVLIRLKPTLYSLKSNRSSIVRGTDQLRLHISKVLWDHLFNQGISLSIKAVGSTSYLSKKVDPPPIEVVVKGNHIGTPKHIYKNMECYKTKRSTFIHPGDYHEPYVRFDWRNPLPYRDECLPIWLADQFIDTRTAERTALKSFDILSKFLKTRKIELYDICFFITSDGLSIFGEVSPDCMRVKHQGEDLDKDLWRNGKTEDEVLNKWSKLLELIKD